MHKDPSQNRMQRIEQLIQELDAVSDPAIRAKTITLIQLLMELHGEGIERLMEIVSAANAGQQVVDTVANDQLVAGLLMLYGLHPVPFEKRVSQALEKVRPYLKSHGGDVELLGVDENVIRLRMVGSCHGCPSSAMTLKMAIEEAIYERAPDHAGLIVEGVTDNPDTARQPVAIQPLSSEKSARAKVDWIEVNGLSGRLHDRTQTIDVGGEPVMFCRLDDDLYAYGTTCTSCGNSLDNSLLEAGNVVCSVCGQAYDIKRAGTAIGETSVQLKPFPLLIENGAARVAVSLTNLN